MLGSRPCSTSCSTAWHGPQSLHHCTLQLLLIWYQGTDPHVAAWRSPVSIAWVGTPASSKTEVPRQGSHPSIKTPHECVRYNKMPLRKHQ